MSDEPLQHIGGAWECVDAWPGVFFVAKACLRQQTIDYARTALSELSESRWPDTIAYAEREPESP